VYNPTKGCKLSGTKRSERAEGRTVKMEGEDAVVFEGVAGGVDGLL
jgi:hypothetical protein